MKRKSPAETAPERLFAAVRPPRRPRLPASGELMVLTSDEDLVRWSRTRMIEVLVREARIERGLAERIAGEIEATLSRAGLRTVSTPVLRELVGAELVSRGLTTEWMLHSRLGVSLYDVGAILRGSSGALSGDGERSPEASSLALGGRIKRDYALAAVFSDKVAAAHRSGAIHIHDLEAIDRPHSLSLTQEGIEACIRGGDLGHDPAADAETLAARLARLAGILGGHLGGPLRIEALNVVLAPYLAARSAAELAQAAATVVALLGDGHAGLAGGVEATLLWDVAPEVAAAAALGPRARPAGRYGDHTTVMRAVALALVEALAKSGRPGGGLDLCLVIGRGFFRASGHLALLERAVEAARVVGSPRFRFVRPGERGVSAARGEGPRVVGLARAARDTVLSLVSVSLPRVGLVAGEDEDEVETRLVSALDLAARAHMERRVFLEELLARGARGPLGPLVDGARGGPFLDVEEALQPILLCGLNELCELVVGGPLHEGAAIAFAERILTRTGRHIDRLSRRYRLRFLAGGAPDHAVAGRCARLNLRHHPLHAGRHLKGELRRGQVRYTPGVALDLEAAVPVRQRLELEGRLHALVPWGSCSTVTAEDLGRGAALVMEAYTRSRCRELRVAPVEAPR